MKLLNLGSGDIEIKGVESCDINIEFKTDHCFDIKKVPWPLESDSYDEVYLFHTIEHIEKIYHDRIFNEVLRILKADGIFIISFPEFEVILQNWLENRKGMREFWERNVYGLQRTPSDYHVCAMDATEVRDKFIRMGFKNIEVKAEAGTFYNTVIRCQKGEPMKSYEKLVFEEVIK